MKLTTALAGILAIAALVLVLWARQSATGKFLPVAQIKNERFAVEIRHEASVDSSVAAGADSIGLGGESIHIRRCWPLMTPAHAVLVPPPLELRPPQRGGSSDQWRHDDVAGNSGENT